MQLQHIATSAHSVPSSKVTLTFLVIHPSMRALSLSVKQVSPE